MLRRHPDDRAIAALAVPALAALAADPLYSLVDTALIGHLGAAELGAVAVGSAAFTASFWLFSFLAYAVTPTVARALGRGDRSAATAIGVQALLIAMAVGLLLAGLGVLLAEPIVSLLGGSGEVADLGVPYLQIRVLAAPFVLIALAGNGWLRGAQNTRTPMFIAVAGAAANAVLGWLFIYPVGMGVPGAACATVICQGAAAVAFVLVLRGRFHLPRWRFDPAVARSLLTVGADLVVRTGFLLAGLTLATSLAARMGEVPLASWQIVMQIFLLLSLTMDSLAIAAQALVAKELGALDRGAARRIGDRLMELGVALGVALGAILFLASGPLASVFTSDLRVEAETRELIRMLAIAQPVAAAAFTLDGILIGALETRFLAYAMVAASIVFAAFSFLAYNNEWGTTGLAVGAGIWLMARLATTLVRYRRSFARSIEV
jgi:putative MATE family efflux protein